MDAFPGNQHMHAYSVSPHFSEAFSPLEPIFKLSDGFYLDPYAVRSFGSLRRQQIQIRRIPASTYVVSKLCQGRWIFYPSRSLSRPVRLCGIFIELKMVFKPGSPVIGLATLLL